MKKIICINQVSGPLMIDMMNFLVDKGCEVVLYTGEIAKTSDDLHESVKIRKLISYKKNNAANRLFTWLLFFVQALMYLCLDSNKKTKVYLTSNPPFIPLLAPIIRGKPYIHIYDVYPNALLALPYITKTSMIYKLFSYFNKKSFAKAEHVFTPSQGMKEMLMAFTDEDHVSVIPWWADTEFIKPVKKNNNTFITEHNLDNKFVVMYSGNFGLTHNIEKLLYSALQLKNETDIVFVIIGDGPKSRVVDLFSKSNDLNNLVILPFQSDEVLPYSLTAADISVVLDSFSAGKTFESTASIPSKTYYMMAAGSVIYGESDSTSELSKLIKTFDIGLCDSTQSIDIFVNFILRCKNNPDLLSSFKKNSRSASLNFTKDNARLLHEYIFHA
jgi:glycosyltransferase involved in cell wall biosynthesis